MKLLHDGSLLVVGESGTGDLWLVGREVDDRLSVSALVVSEVGVELWMSLFLG